jgi:hypothetical protein
MGAARARIAAVIGANVMIVAIRRRTRLALSGLAGFRAVASVMVGTRSPVGDRRVAAHPRQGIAGIGGARIIVVAINRRALLAGSAGRVTGLGPVALILVVLADHRIGQLTDSGLADAFTQTKIVRIRTSDSVRNGVCRADGAPDS